MKKRIISTMLMLITSLSMLSGCTKEVDDQDTIKESVELSSNYTINEKSKIKDDLSLLGMNVNDSVSDLALSDIKAIFPGDLHTLVYFSIPEDTENAAYRVENITIHDKAYKTKCVEVDGCYQKYVIEEFVPEESGEYQISKINYVNEKTKKTSTYNLSQLITTKIEKERYFFEQEYHYSVVLSGQNFECVYQFNKENNAFVDLWANLIRSTEKLDMDQRSFYYFAFNCYDPKKDIHFVPEDILRLDVNYTLETYDYKGKDKEAAENITNPKVKKDISQSIKADEVVVAAKDHKRSNKKLYKYQTINKLCDADLAKNIEDTNAAVLKQAARQYDWAVAFGSGEGYPYKVNKAGWILPEYDIEYSKIKDFETIKIKYRYEGKTLEAKTGSLIVDEPSEPIFVKPTKPDSYEKNEYTLWTIWNCDRNVFWKLKETVRYWLKEHIVFVTIVCIVVIGIVIRKLLGAKNVRKIRDLIVVKIINMFMGD